MAPYIENGVNLGTVPASASAGSPTLLSPVGKPQTVPVVQSQESSTVQHIYVQQVPTVTVPTTIQGYSEQVVAPPVMNAPQQVYYVPTEQNLQNQSPSHSPNHCIIQTTTQPDVPPMSAAPVYISTTPPHSENSMVSHIPGGMSPPTSTVYYVTSPPPPVSVSPEHIPVYTPPPPAPMVLYPVPAEQAALPPQGAVFQPVVAAPKPASSYEYPTATINNKSNTIPHLRPGESLSTQLEVVWHGEFAKLFRQFPVKWTLMPQTEIEGVRTFMDSAKVRFICPKCKNCWTSMKGRVLFGYELDTIQNEGVVLFKLYGQKCSKCKDPEYVHAMWYPEEVKKVIQNIHQKIAQTFYNWRKPMLRLDRRTGRPSKPHNPDICQACEEGVCKEERNYS